MAGPASAGPAAPACPGSTGLSTALLDIDRDGVKDVVAGAPRFDATTPPKLNAGAVAIRYGDLGSQVITPGKLGVGQPTVRGHFGAAAAIGDMSGDGCADIAVGEPGTGTVYLLNGSEGGITGAGAQLLHGPQAGDQFGAAVAETDRVTTGAPPTARDLWIGAPGTDVPSPAGTVADVGAVYHYAVGADGVARLLEVLTPGVSPMLSSQSHQGDRFGEVLAGRSNGVTVGHPSFDTAGTVNSGAVTSMTVDITTGLVSGAQTFTQASAGVPGAPQDHDRFGASVAGDSGTVAVGVPGDHVAGKAAGAVQLLTTNSSNQLTAGPRITQSSPRVPGRNEPQDQFGASVVVSPGSLLCSRVTEEDGYSIVIGTPGEDVGGRRAGQDVGAVTVVDRSSNGGDHAGSCAPVVWRQGHGFAGTAERDDRLGTALGAIRGGQQNEDDYVVTLLAGAPAEDVHGVRNAGVASVRQSGVAGTPMLPRFLGFPRGGIAGLRFGTVFAAYQVGYH